MYQKLKIYVSFVCSQVFMLKKSADIALILILVISTSGIAVTRHYCGRVQKSITLYATPKSCCGDKCHKCRNVFIFNKVQDHFVAESSVHAPSIADFITLHTSFFVDLFDNVAISPSSGFIIQRAVDNLAAGYSPATLGNFRC